jgi:hypothetical protein
LLKKVVADPKSPRPFLLRGCGPRYSRVKAAQ